MISSAFGARNMYLPPSSTSVKLHPEGGSRPISKAAIVSERRKARRAVRLDLNMWATKPDGKSPLEAERRRRTRTSLIQVKEVRALLPGQIFDPAIAASSAAMNSGDQGSPGSGTRLCPARLKCQRGLPRQSI